MESKAKSRIDLELQELRDENRRLKERFALLLDLGRRITSSLDTPTVLQEVVDAACKLTGARYGALAIFNEASRVQEFVTHGISQEAQKRIGKLPEGLGILGLLHETQKPLRLTDLAKHPSSVGFPPHHPPMKTFLGAPISYEDESLGNLYLTEKVKRGEFTPEDEQVLILFAAQAAMAIKNTRSHEMVKEAQEQIEDLALERGRLLDLADQEQKRLQALIHSSPVGVFVAEAGSRQVLLVNQEARRILGQSQLPSENLEWYEQEVIYRRTDGGAYDPKDLPLQRALSRGETVRAEEIRFEFPDGHSILTLVNATPIYAVNGTISAAITTIQDITPLEELEKLRSEFLGIVSHELKTPLTAIKGSAATVLTSSRPFDSEETHELFEIIDEQSDRLRDLVDNLLDMTRIESGSLPVKLESIDLTKILEDAKKTFVRGGGAHEILLHVPDNLPSAQADRLRVSQVLGNLLSNAAKFSPETEPITVFLEHSDLHITVHVKDRGRGIPQDMLPHLFKKFSRIHEESRPKLAGTGLGLAISKGIVEAHGGRIWVNSPGNGKGAVFSFTLPTATFTESTHQTVTSRKASHMGKVSRAGEKASVLVVDDEPQVLRLLRRSLEKAGYRPIPTSDPTEVASLIETEEPDLALLDLMLPGTTGFDLLQRIREFSGVPVIFLTANRETENAIRALEMGADDYITKPFSPPELLARIEAALRRRVMPDVTEVRPPFVLDKLAINFAERRVTMGGTPVSLSATEYKLLYELATNAGRVLTHDQILQKVWGSEYSGETELVRSFVRNLRRKLGDDARNPKYIFTEPQVGYRMPKSHGS